LLLALALVACTGEGADDASGGPSDGGTSDGSTPSAPTEPAEPDPAPVAGQCHRLDWDSALSPLAGDTLVPCRERHTSQTFFVGRLRPAELAALDAPRVQSRVAEVCGRRLADHAGAGPAALRLTMVETVWFTPSLERADLGADWFRCDLVVVAGPERLMPLPRRSAGLATEESVQMCGTAEPGTRGFRRVPCARDHAWRALSSVDLPGKRYPGADALSAELDDACRDTASEHADDPLTFRWAEELPTRQQWRAGRRYGLCWVPVDA
jgi:hypothetical protein